MKQPFLTRHLGASIGDFLSQSHDDGGLGLGTVGTSVIFLIAILSIVIFLTITNKDERKSVENVSRAKIVNDANADLFLSIHINYMPNSSDFRGSETLYGKPDFPKNTNFTSKRFAQLVQSELVSNLKGN